RRTVNVLGGSKVGGSVAPNIPDAREPPAKWPSPESRTDQVRRREVVGAPRVHPHKHDANYRVIRGATRSSARRTKRTRPESDPRLPPRLPEPRSTAHTDVASAEPISYN